MHEYALSSTPRAAAPEPSTLIAPPPLERLLDWDDLEQLTGLHRRSIRRLIAKSQFPSGVKISPKRRVFRQSAIARWLAEREAAAA